MRYSVLSATYTLLIETLHNVCLLEPRLDYINYFKIVIATSVQNMHVTFGVGKNQETKIKKILQRPI